MEFKIENCNSIKEGSFQIEPGKVNIKYAMNGTGKTTFARAIEAAIKDRDTGSNELAKLKHFKYHGLEGQHDPAVKGLDEVEKVAIFNEKYVEQYVFLPDEVLKNSFEIFIRDETYEKRMSQINELLEDVREMVTNDEEHKQLMKKLYDLKECFGKSKDVSRVSSVIKGLSKGNKVAHIPKELEVYTGFIRHKDNVKWLDWQLKGQRYMDVAEVCPYCATTVADQTKETILAVRKHYSSNKVGHLRKFEEAVENFQEYLPLATYRKLLSVIQNVNGFKEEHEQFLLSLKKQLDILIGKMEAVHALDFHMLKDVDEVEKAIYESKIDLFYLDHFYSATHLEKNVSRINDALDKIARKAEDLSTKVGSQKNHMEKTIRTYEASINHFLKYAGYHYAVEVVNDKMCLRHNEASIHVENPRVHLSYGEKNAFALVLFMFEALRNESDLIVLDDPISSFDKHKKIAVINMLFNAKYSEHNLKERTVLMLTHDIDPLVTMVDYGSKKFGEITSASFIENIEGIITERPVKREDVQTFFDIVKENLESLDSDIIKLIYLRRLKEIIGDKKDAYQLLSNLFKARRIGKDEVTYGVGRGARGLTENEIKIATKEISDYIPGFSYEGFVNQLFDETMLINLYRNCDSNYEKLQLYRLICAVVKKRHKHKERRMTQKKEDNVMLAFINGTYHVENNDIYQLNPHRYQTIPTYLIKECDQNILALEEALLQEAAI